jgi:hypothetical protein
MGSGPQTDKHLIQSPFISQFFLDDEICFGVNIVNKSMVHSKDDASVDSLH